MDKSERPALVACLLGIAMLIAIAAAVPDASNLPAWGAMPDAGAQAVTVSSASGSSGTSHSGSGAPAGPSQPDNAPATQPATQPGPPKTLPGGQTKIFGDGRFLVAYYGTAETGALGVLGETSPDQMQRRVHRAAQPFARRHQPVQVVYELIVTIADRYPGKGGDYSHDIPRAEVQKYIDAAHRHDALLLLDIQPGRSDFLTVAKRWAWALKDPYVGLALDPEWRMGRHGVPGTRIGSVDAREVNRVSAWLRDLVARHHLPQKLFVLHQFRVDMIDHIGSIEPRRGLVMVQHVDGFGTPGQKLDTFHTVVRPHQFFLGFKLFYDEDVHRMSPAEVRRIRPKVRFVSFQ
ncbi:MAG TPA: hypothetical protein VFV89_00090 [Nocardioides sp.]|uniref:hypothetical protein n=1 Tax=Nocardioides sp. TaxID=35761 RepID=UPI002E31841A|nr:hypothetical protein [Nocardioides sp.]HEX5086175.1 hypothetical protein [Nocardioides sp.]